MGLFDKFKRDKNEIKKDVMDNSYNIPTGKELSIEQASSIIKSMVEQLNYPYHIFSNKISQEEIFNEYKLAFERGKKEGFVPVLVPEDDILDEYFGIMKDDGYSVNAVLNKISNNGKDILNKRFDEGIEPYSNEEFDMQDFMGEVAGGMPVDEFASLIDFSDLGMKEIVLIEVPTTNPWEVVAYVPFGGWNDCPDVEDMTAICKYWYEKYGAVPAVITHDTLEFILPQIVSDNDAIEVAKEHFAFSTDRVFQCTSTSTLGEVVDCIRKSKIWYFWWD